MPDLKENTAAKKYRIKLDVDNKNDARIIAFSYIFPQSIVLDVGCACGDFGVLLNQDKNCTVYGMEYNAGSIKVAEKTNAYRQIQKFDLNKLEENNFDNYHEYFTCIAFIDVLEHLMEPDVVLKKFKTFLKKDGFFIISIPNIGHCSIKAKLLLNDFTYTEMGILDKTHVRFFTYKSIVSLFSSLALEIEESKGVLSDVMFHEPGSNNHLPFAVKRLIYQDPHSYVFQYVMKVKPSNLDPIRLHQHNQQKIQIKWNTIMATIGKMRFQRVARTFFPPKFLPINAGKKFYSLLKRFTHLF
ncbi:MAG: class I SAM-dependent methyltransferase [Candidatus Ozemobacteraceae bacterium]